MSNYLQYALYRWFVALLEQYLQTHPIARAIALETGFRLTRAGGKRSIRKPDLGVVLNSNPIPLGDRDRSYHGTFDLCIESLSDSTQREVERDTVHKKGEYAQAGVREYFILDPEGQHLSFFRLLSKGIYVPIKPDADSVIESEVLPGFRFRLDDLDKQPPIISLTRDPVYQSYVFPEHQRIRQQAEETTQENERLKAMLRELGVSIDDES